MLPEPRPEAGGSTSAGVIDHGGRPRLDRTTFEEAVQLIGKSLGRRVAPGGVLLQALESDRFQLAGDSWIQPPWRHGVLAADLIERFQRRSSLKGRAAGQQLVEDGAQRIDVGSRPDSGARRGRCSAPYRRASPTARPGSSRMRSDRPGAGLCRNQRLWEMRLSTAPSGAESRRMFEGFRSRCSRPASCTALIA